MTQSGKVENAMWVFTTFGFFSVVAHRDKPRYVMVRSRFRKDIEALIDAVAEFNASTRPACVTTPDGDYPFRVTITREEFARVLVDQLADMSYDNFKNEIARTQGHGRAHVYGQVWGVMRAAEDSREGLRSSTQSRRPRSGKARA